MVFENSPLYSQKREGNFTTDVINKIIKAYPKIKLIESNISHNQLAKEELIVY